jgi:hypothetical protein
MSDLRINSGGSRERRLTAELTAQAREIAALRGERDAILAELIARNAVVGQLQVAIEDKAREIASLKKALLNARGAIEGWIGSGYLVPGNMHDALSSIDAVLNGSPAPDPVEAMRARCEAIARETSEEHDGFGYEPNALRIADAIAALKGNGEGK